MVAPQPLRLLAPGQLYLSSKQFTVSCQSRCVMGVRMRRDDRGGGGGGHDQNQRSDYLKDILSGLSMICPTSVDLSPQIMRIRITKSRSWSFYMRLCWVSACLNTKVSFCYC